MASFGGFLRALYGEWSTLVAGAFSALAFIGSAVVLLLARLGVVDPATAPVFLASLVMWVSGTLALVWAAYRVWGREHTRALRIERQCGELQSRLEAALVFVMEDGCCRQGSLVRVGVVNPNPTMVRDARAYMSIPTLGVHAFFLSWASTATDGEALDIQEGVHRHTAWIAGTRDVPNCFFLTSGIDYQDVGAGRYVIELRVTGADVRSARARVEVVFATPRSMTARLLLDDDP